MLTRTGLGACSTTLAYQQPLIVFARPLWPQAAGASPAPPGQGSWPGRAVLAQHIPGAGQSVPPRSCSASLAPQPAPGMEAGDGKEETPLSSALSRFQLSEDYGFLLPNPLTELPAPYGPWMEIAHELPQLIASHRLRSRVHQMPQLSTRHLRGREELYLAHLVLSFITMGYLWQEGEEGTVKVLPRHLAVPFWEVSQALGLPPILSHADFVLANWRRKDPSGPLEIENLDPIISLPGGESLRGFILVTFLVEKAAVPGIKAIPQAIQCHPAARRGDPAPGPAGAGEGHRGHGQGSAEDARLRGSSSVLCRDPDLSLWLEGQPLRCRTGWCTKGSPRSPWPSQEGARHRAPSCMLLMSSWGFATARKAPQFLHRMRDYMPPPHRAFIEEIGRAPSLKQHVLCSGDARLRAAFNRCITCAGGLQVLPHRHRHQVHRRGQSQGGAGGGGRLGWEAPGRAGGQRDRGVAHLQLPEERQGHHQGRADKRLMPRRLRAGPGGHRTQAGVCSA
uniref:Indoleamine 2,3-dioxygenase 2 n=1 Tax=Anas platyrhynchos TaxID=8839 RepID=A0A8B9T3W6_ANAPL